MGNEVLNYSEELKRFIKTVAQETTEDKTDGILGKLLQITGGEREVYEFVVGEGFNITYVEFLAYYKACQVGVEAVNAELTDEDLDDVAGGFGFSSVKKLAKKASNTVSNVAYDTTKYVADNPGAFIAGAGAIGGGAGTVAGAVVGGAIGSSAAGVGVVPGATIGGVIGGGVGTVAGGVIGMGTVIIANELTN